VSGPRIRLADGSDAADVTRLLAGFRDWWGYQAPSDEALASGVERLLADAATDFLLAPGDSGQPVGVCALRYRYGVWLDGLDCCLEDLFVEERARGGGVGAELVRAAIQRARERGCRRMELDTNEDNAAARALYESFGFVNDRYGGRDLYYRLHLDAGPDA
jgi:GNAT superfamily N-acetyltransferase